jgi:anti-sigma regulatory factor (Ser/Thr protein kinase)
MHDQRRPPNRDQALQRVAEATQRRSIRPHLEVSLAPSADAPTRARAEVATWLEQQAPLARLIHDACLLVSEVVTNCIRHAQISQTQPLRLSASLRAANLRIEVHDNGTDAPSPGERPNATGVASASTSSRSYPAPGASIATRTEPPYGSNLPPNHPPTSDTPRAPQSQDALRNFAHVRAQAARRGTAP